MHALRVDLIANVIDDIVSRKPLSRRTQAGLSLENRTAAQFAAAASSSARTASPPEAASAAAHGRTPCPPGVNVPAWPDGQRALMWAVSPAGAERHV